MTGGSQMERAAVDNHAILRLRALLVRAAFWTGIVGLILGLTTSGLRYGMAPARDEFGGMVRVGRSLVPQPGDPPLYVERGHFHLVNLRDGEGLPSWVRGPWASEAMAREARVAQQRTGLIALYNWAPENCTYHGVQWQLRHRSGAIIQDAPDGYFATACEHSRFSKAGIGIFGSASDHLATMPVRRTADGGVEVDTNRIRWPRGRGYW